MTTPKYEGGTITVLGSAKSTFISWFTPESEMLMFVAGARRRAEGTVGEVGSGTG